MTEQEETYIKVEPEVAALMRRAAELALRHNTPRIALSEILEALLFRPMTPALIEQIIRASSLAQDSNSSALAEVHVVKAMLDDPNSFASQVLEQTSGDPAQFRQAVATFIQNFPTPEENEP